MNVYDEVQKIWENVPRSEDVKNTDFNLTAHRQLLSVFHVGSYFTYVVNIRRSLIEHVSFEVTSLLGYSPEDITVPFLVSLMHPHDVPYFLNFESASERFFNDKSGEDLFKYKVQYDFRIKNAAGNYVRLLHQYMIIQHDATDVLTFAVDTDITHLKLTGVPQLSFIGINDAPSYYNVDPERIFLPKKSFFTKRELDILRALSAGKNSYEMAEDLNISKHTVDVHRKNLIKKTGAKSTYEILNKAFTNGWV
nr:LuxR C-terminal-related transcriptional regulator [uncultured Flavobacterium sp.]